MAHERHRGVSGDRPQRIAGQSDHTILNVDADGVERIAIAHAIILQLPHDFLLQLRVGNIAGRRQSSACYEPQLRSWCGAPFIDLFFGREVRDGAFKVDDSIRNRYLYVLELL